MTRNLQGKSALVTGGCPGIGAATVRLLARRGAAVAFTCLPADRDRAESFCRELEQEAARVAFHVADVSDYGLARKVVERVAADFGSLEILVNNAGINRDRVLWKMSEEEWDAVLAVDLKGPFNYMAAAAELFRKQGSGRIISVSSINGLRGKFGQANYTAAKAGLIGLSKTAARELARHQVTVNVVCPGLIDTDMIRSMPEEQRLLSLKGIPLGRMGRPEDVAEMIAFFAGEGAAHVTGQVVQVDGGQYL